MKKRRSLWIIPLCLLLAAGIAVGGYFWYTGREPKPVTVYSIEDCYLYTYYQSDSGVSSGMVSADRLQTIHLSTTQDVTQVYVQQGQNVTKGQKLMAYDTTLSQLSLDQQKLDIDKTKLRLEDAKAHLAEIKKMKPITYNPGTPAPTTKPTAKPTTSGDRTPTKELGSSGFMLLGGAGTAGDPCIIWVRANLEFDTSEDGNVSQIMEGFNDSMYAILQVREKDKAAGKVIDELGVLFRMTTETVAVPTPSEPENETESTEPTEPVEPTEPSEPSDPQEPTDPTEPTEPEPTEPEPTEPEPTEPTEPVTVRVTRYSFSFFDASEDPPATQPPASGPDINMNSGYTASEISQMRSEKEQEIKELQFAIRMAEAEYKIMQKEFDNGEVLAEIDGYVTSVLTPEEAMLTGQPIIKVSGGGGFTVEGAVSELRLAELSVGQQVEVNSWEYGSFTGTITAIGDYPVGNDFYGGNPNTSYYPFTVSVDESANLESGAFVEILYTGQQQNGNIYLETAFLRSENGAYYVYVQNEEGLLEKRPIQVGGVMMSGYYTEILEGLTPSDRIAFPYGKGLKEGAPTVVGTSDDLYNGMYY